MNTQRYSASDVTKAVRRLNMDADRPMERYRDVNKHNVGRFDCDRSGSAFWKLYEVVNEGGAERTIAYAQTAQLACVLIDTFRQGYIAGQRSEQEHAMGVLA